MAKLYSIKQAAEKIGMTDSRLRVWIRKGIARPSELTHGFCPRSKFNLAEIKRLKEVKEGGISAWGF